MPIGPSGSRYRRIPGNWQRVGIFSPRTLTLQTILFTAVAFGTVGTAPTIEIIAGGPLNRALSVSVTGSAITITPATNGSGVITTTQAQAATAVNGSGPASALVAASGGGATAVAAAAATPLTGGSDYVFGTAR